MSDPVAHWLDTDRVAEALARAGFRAPGEPSPRLERGWPTTTGGCAVYRDAAERFSLHSIAAAPSPALRGALAAGEAIEVPELGAWALRLRDDPALSRLAELTHASRAGERLRSWLPGPAVAGAGRVLSYKPMRRCVASFGEGELIVKWVRPDQIAPLRERYARWACRAQLGPLELAAPDGVCEPWDALVWRVTPGAPLLERLGKPEAPDLTRSLGAGLARFAGLPVDGLERYDAASEIKGLETWSSWVARVDGGVAAEVRTVLATLGANSPAPPDGRVCAHRDLHDGQLLVDGERLTLLDLDTVGAAAAELDVANFLAHLSLRAMQGRSVDPRARGAFLAGYAAVRGAHALDPKRLTWYEAAALLRLACVYALRPRWVEVSVRLAKAAASAASDNSSPELEGV